MLAFFKFLFYNAFCVRGKCKQSVNKTRIDAPLAQLVEHLTLNQGVQGSSP